MIKAAVLGSPISHSLSPLLHKTAYEQLGVKGSYEAIEVNAGELAKFMDGEAEKGDEEKGRNHTDKRVIEYLHPLFFSISRAKLRISTAAA